MKKDLDKVRRQLLDRQSKPVKLRVAASIVHHELTGRDRQSMPAKDYFEAMNETARNLAGVADIYYVNEARRLLRVPGEDLRAGEIANGGDVLRMPNGFVYRELSMRRAEVMDATVALKLAKRALVPPPAEAVEKS